MVCVWCSCGNSCCWGAVCWRCWLAAGCLGGWRCRVALQPGCHSLRRSFHPHAPHHTPRLLQRTANYNAHAHQPTPEVAVFDLLGIPLVHGWLVDPEADAATAVAFGNKSYNKLVELLFLMG